MSLLLSFILALWFKYEISVFPTHINRQIYNEMKSVYPFHLEFNSFLNQSSLKIKHKSLNNLFFITLPIVSLTFSLLPIHLMMILFILIYLSQLDYYYYLTDIKYIAIVFLFSIYDLLFENSENIQSHLFTFFIISLFFATFIPLVNYIAKKSMLGLGDILLFIALSPLFELEKILLLMLYASILGLLFATIYWLIKRQKIARLPFIPFITASTFLLFIDKIPP